MSAFLARTYRMVPAGKETSYIDIEAELNDLLQQYVTGPCRCMYFVGVCWSRSFSSASMSI